MANEKKSLRQLINELEPEGAPETQSLQTEGATDSVVTQQSASEDVSSPEKKQLKSVSPRESFLRKQVNNAGVLFSDEKAVYKNMVDDDLSNDAALDLIMRRRKDILKTHGLY